MKARKPDWNGLEGIALASLALAISRSLMSRHLELCPCRTKKDEWPHEVHTTPVQLLYAKKLEEGLSTTTVVHAHAVLHGALNTAIRLGLVQRNVAALVNPPRVMHHEMATLSPGVRQSELLALRWQDVGLDQATLQVRGH